MKAYNVWYIHEAGIERGHWTDYNHSKYHANIEPGYGMNNPKRMSLEEARIFLASIVKLGETMGLINEARKFLTSTAGAPQYIILEMDVNNNPIVPKCRKTK